MKCSNQNQLFNNPFSIINRCYSRLHLPLKIRRVEFIKTLTVVFQTWRKCLEEELKRLTKRFQITFSRVLSIISSSKLSTFPKRCRVCEQLVLLNPNGWISVALQLKTLFTMTNLLESNGQKATDVKAFKSKVHSLVLLPHRSTAGQKAWH